MHIIVYILIFGSNNYENKINVLEIINMNCISLIQIHIRQ
jgi:hypothetical protein